MTRRQAILIIASVLVSAFSIGYILSDAPLEDVLATIQKADGGQLALAAVFMTASLVTRGIRWRELLGRRVRLVDAFHLVNIMFLGNQLPLRLGEVARTLLVSRRGVPMATAAASIVVERLMDTLLVVLMLAAAVSQLPDAPRTVTDAAAFFGLAGLGGFGLLLICARMPARALALVAAVTRWIPALRRLPLLRLSEHLLDGLGALADTRTLLLSLFWTVMSWAMSLATFYCLQVALAIDVDAALSVPLSVSLAALGIALPVSVAALGPFEAAIIVAGQLVGMASLDAVSLGFLYHGMSIIGFVIWGGISMLALGMAPWGAFATDTSDADLS